MESKQADTFPRTTPIHDSDSDTSIRVYFFFFFFFNWTKLDRVLSYWSVTDSLCTTF